MGTIRRALGTTLGKILTLPALILTILIVGVAIVLLDDLARGGGPCRSAIYDKSAVVFDAVTICGTSGVSAEKLDHAAAVAAQWLDNGQDGIADEPRLIEQLKTTEPIALMTESGISLWPGLRSVIAMRGLGSSQDLGAQETNPGNGRRDAAPEEIHHLIMNAGWQKLWPDTFSETTSVRSTLYQAWESAEGDGLYSYDDPTCDSSCKVSEFVYLATAAYMGSDIDLETDELRIPNQSRLRELAPSVVEIFESTDYVYPTTMWPDGNYPHTQNIKPG